MNMNNKNSNESNENNKSDKNNENNENINKDIKIINGDCLIEMKNIEDKSIDLVLCDLPYGITKNKWDIVLDFDKLWNEYERIIKNNGIIILFGNQPFTSKLILSNLKMFKYTLVWEKNKFSDFLNAKKKILKIHEDIVIFYKKSGVYNPQFTYDKPYKRSNTQKSIDKQTNYNEYKESKMIESVDGKRYPTSVLFFNRVENGLHPTQKPVELLEYLIKTYSNENSLVLDNCMGVGSTLIACMNTKRKCIGIEINNDYYNIAKTLVEKNEKKLL